MFNIICKILRIIVYNRNLLPDRYNYRNFSEKEPFNPISTTSKSNYCTLTKLFKKLSLKNKTVCFINQTFLSIFFLA